MLVRSPRALILWGAAVVVAIATGAFVASDLATLHRRATQLGPERDVVVARRDLPVGAIVDDADLQVRRVHASQLPPGILADRAVVSGRVVTATVLRGGFVASRNLAPRDRDGLSGALPPRSRAMRFVVSDAVRPRRGANVDVLATFGIAGDAPVDETGAVSPGEAVVVAQGSLVLEVDDARASDGSAGVGVTLLLTPKEARELAFATTHGVVTIVLVPPEEAQRP